MKKLAWTLLPFALAGSTLAGYVARGKQVKTVITTVVQIQTVAPPPPATKHLTAIVQGSASCLSATSLGDLSADAFTLRRPGNGLTSGDVVAVAETSAMDDTNCNFNVTYAISPNLGFFMVSDDSKGDAWGPFDSHQLASRGWVVRLNK